MRIKNSTTSLKTSIVDSSILYNTGEEPSELMLVPDNNGELIIPLSKEITLRLIGSAKPINLDSKRCFFLKPRRRGMAITTGPNAKFLIAKINPIYVRNICSDLLEINNGVHEIILDSQFVRKLKMADSHKPYELEDILKQEAHICNKDIVNSTVAESIERIKDSSGIIKVKDIYSSLKVSKSKLEQHFNREIGLTPKEFCKIEKINSFINMYKNNEDQNLTELTYKCGYYDQSHLIKDFKYFLETSPKKYFAHAKAV